MENKFYHTDYDIPTNSYRTHLWVDYHGQLVWITSEIHKEDDGWWGEVQGCKGCVSQGDSLIECMENIKEAYIAWRETLEESRSKS